MAPLYTRRQPSARNACSSQHRPASEAVSSARAAVPPTDVPAFRAFRRHRSRRVSLLRQAGCAARAASVCRHRQRPDPPQHVAEQPPGQMPFRQQEPVVPGVLHQPAAGFHQPLLETRERPAFDPRRQDQSAPEVAQVVRQDAQLQAHLVRPEPMARQPRPVGRLFAFFKAPPVFLDTD